MKKSEMKIDKKLCGGIRHPYIKNSISYRCELYTSDKATRPVMSSGVHTGFNVPLLPVILAAVVALGAVYFAVIKKIIK